MGGNVPLGYEPDGRTLKIIEADAEIIRTIYDLYQKHENIRATKEGAHNLGLRTAIRTLSSGRLKEGTEFSFGHVHHILTNPIYAGSEAVFDSFAAKVRYVRTAAVAAKCIESPESALYTEVANGPFRIFIVAVNVAAQLPRSGR